MNAREGFRRVGLLLGIAGCVAGLVASAYQYYFLASKLDDARRFQVLAGNYRRFMQKYPHYPVRKGPFEEMASEDTRVESDAEKDQQKEEWDSQGIDYVSITGTEISCIGRSPLGFRLYGDSPSVGAWLVPITFPFLGFLIPWIAVRILLWVGSGFAKAT
jgi:hypothetical protein